MSEFTLFIDANWKNLLSILWFLICFNGYAYYAAKAARANEYSLASLMHFHRKEWMQRMLTHEIRIADTTVISNLERGVAFFASTTMLVLAGLVTVLGSTEKAIDIISDIPFATHATTVEWEMKLLLLVSLFVYAFFKFTWALRQYGFSAVMLGGAPLPSDNIADSARTAYAIRISNMMSLAARNFNIGLRTYYFCSIRVGIFNEFSSFMGIEDG